MSESQLLDVIMTFLLIRRREKKLENARRDLVLENKDLGRMFKKYQINK